MLRAGRNRSSLTLYTDVLQAERKKERKSERGEISADALVKVETAKRKCLTVRTTFVVNSIKFKQCWSLNNTPVARLADEDCREER